MHLFGDLMQQQQQEEPGAHLVFRDEESCSSSCARQHVHVTAAPVRHTAIRIRIRFLGWLDSSVSHLSFNLKV